MTNSPLATLYPLEPSGEDFYRQVLIADDDAMIRAILLRSLESWGYEVTVAEDGAKAWYILQQPGSPELLMLDWVMPEIDGAELCRRVRARPASPYPYILLITGKDDKQDLIQGLEAGADDYLTKPFDRNELRARLRVGRRILALQHKLINAREGLRFAATHDALTGLWNRSALLDSLRRELERSARTGTATAVVMLDLDHFKQINDTYGHLQGDAVLRDIADRILQNVRSYDLVGRYGGEEFLLVFPDCDRQQIEQSANRIRLAIFERPVLTEAGNIPVTASLGATVVIDGVSSDEKILSAADQALYQAKNSGRNRVVVF